MSHRPARRGNSFPSLPPPSPATSTFSASSSTSSFSLKSRKSLDSLRFLSFSAISSNVSLATSASSSTVNLASTLNRDATTRRKATLLSRGMDYISVRNQFTAWSSHFPHQDKDRTAGDGIDQVYCDLLELLSPVTPHKINDRVWRLLLPQIATRQTRYLVLALKHSSSDKICYFFSQLFNQRRASWQRSLNPDRSPVQGDPYHDAVSIDEKHSAVPFIDFVSYTAHGGPIYRQAILKSGFLDLLLYMYVCDFLDPTRYFSDSWERKGRNPPLILSCNSLLLFLCHDQDCLSVILAHPLHVLWPQFEECPFKAGSQGQMLQQRRRTWRMLDKQLRELRFNALDHILLCESEPDLLDACVDFLEFMRAGMEGNSSSDRFKLWQSFGNCVARHSRLESVLSAHLAQYPDDEIIDTFSYIFTEISGLFVNFREMSDWEYGLIEFVIAVVHSRPASRKAMINAGILPALLPMLKLDLRYSIKSDQTILQFSFFSEPDPPMDYIITSKVTDTISRHGLEPLFKQADTNLSGRRLLLCQAFRAMLIPIPEVLDILRDLLGEVEVRNALGRTAENPDTPDKPPSDF